MDETPLWLPLTIAVVGVLGTLGAAVFTQVWQARQEQSRWTLQVEREDAQRWSTDRALTYAEFLALMSEWRKWVMTLRYSAGEVPRDLIDQGMPDGRSYTHDAEKLLARIDLVGSRAVRDAARGLWLWAGASAAALSEAGRSTQNRDTFMRGVEDSYDDCVKSMRVDLGITDASPGTRREGDRV